MLLALHYWMGDAHHCSGPPVSEMTYTVSSGTLNPSIPYHTRCTRQMSDRPLHCTAVVKLLWERCRIPKLKRLESKNEFTIVGEYSVSTTISGNLFQRSKTVAEERIVLTLGMNLQMTSQPALIVLLPEDLPIIHMLTICTFRLSPLDNSFPSELSN